jgi:predicted dehydrogenase
MALEHVRVAIVGCGRIADLQSLGYHDHPRATLLAVCDTDEALARQRAGEWAVPKVHTDLERLLADPEIDAVDVLTPHHLHAQHAVAALDAGKHVSLQKPPTRTLAELDAIAAAAAAARSGRTVRVFENFTHYPPHRRVQALIDEGAIGTPLSIRLATLAGRPGDGWNVEARSQAWRVDPALCGGGPTTFDHGYHVYTLARQMMGAEVARVHAFIHWNSVGDGLWYDGPSLLSWQYEGDLPRYGSWETVASLGMRVRSKYYAADDRLEVHATEGIVWANRCTGHLLDEPSVVPYRDGETRAFHDLATDWAESFRLGAHDFVDALLQGRAPHQTLADARRTLAEALAAGRSAAERREVSLDEILP